MKSLTFQYFFLLKKIYEIQKTKGFATISQIKQQLESPQNITLYVRLFRLKRAGLVSSPLRSCYKLTEDGISVLKKTEEEIEGCK